MKMEFPGMRIDTQDSGRILASMLEHEERLVNLLGGSGCSQNPDDTAEGACLLICALLTSPREDAGRGGAAPTVSRCRLTPAR